MTELILVQKCVIRQLLAAVEMTCKEQENKDIILICEPNEIKVDGLTQTQKKVNLLETAPAGGQGDKAKNGAKGNRTILRSQKHGFVKAQSAEEAYEAVEALFDAWAERKHQTDD